MRILRLVRASVTDGSTFLSGISLKHDDVTNQNKPAALCIVGFIGGLTSSCNGSIGYNL